MHSFLKPQKYSSTLKLKDFKKKLQNDREKSVIRPDVPFVLNGKPYNPHAMKMKKKKNKKKGNHKSKIKFSSNGKPYKVYELSMEGSKNKTSKSKGNEKKSAEKRKKQNSASKPIKDSAVTQLITSAKKTAQPLLKPSSSPIFTYKLPPAFSINSVKSLLSKSAENDKLSDQLLGLLMGGSKKYSSSRTSTTTTTTTTTTSTTTTERSSSHLTNSPIYTYKLPPVFSMNSLRSILGKNKDEKKNQSNSFSFKKYFDMITGVTSTTTTTTTTTKTTTTTVKSTRTKTQVPVSVSSKPASSPFTWIAGQFNGIPSKIFHFRAPFSALSWIGSLGSSRYPGEDIIKG